MTHETDFLDLYRRLGVSPGCELAELKQAYRRHVALLHPDRRQGQPADARSAARLQRLTAQYGAAMEFHKRHGRLPGAPRESADPFAAPRQRVPHESLPQDRPSPAGNRSRGKLVVLLVIVVLATLGWMAHEASLKTSADAVEEDVPAQAVSPVIPHEAADADTVLHAGMSTADVRSLEGEPLAVHGDLWEYGPSWVRFDHDELVEWHSSPLRPLHTASGPSARLP
ncbi:DnaJ domain-containing protein [Dyella jiangningensis]|uniref:J domain-containing protein n=1 Tax=Dyella sp. AtDHG13 TaxID=1938897 RepID=UPI0008874455|nr:J domain-containing protein [Dyella sp. AtDHG13]PXV61427.1 DnaJ-like protein [Dyella sp. AtDHG13]SDJ90440.1 DnaJ domain-containing protein [Dyella jiangningensis]